MSKRTMRIHSGSQKAEIWEDGNCIKNYVISTAKNGVGCDEGSFCTPFGRLKVAKKIGDGMPLGSVFKGRQATGSIWTSEKSEEDLILTRILWLEGVEKQNLNTLNRYIYLHGTNQEHLLGQAASHGCVRFSNLDIVEVFNFLNEGDVVEIC